MIKLSEINSLNELLAEIFPLAEIEFCDGFDKQEYLLNPKKNCFWKDFLKDFEVLSRCCCGIDHELICGNFILKIPKGKNIFKHGFCVTLNYGIFVFHLDNFQFDCEMYFEEKFKFPLYIKDLIQLLPPKDGVNDEEVLSLIEKIGTFTNEEFREELKYQKMFECEIQCQGNK